MTCSQLEDAPPVTSMFSILQNSGPLRDWTGRVSSCVQLTCANIWNSLAGKHDLRRVHLMEQGLRIAWFVSSACSKYFSLLFYIHLWFARWTFLYLWGRFWTNSWLSSSQHMSFNLNLTVFSSIDDLVGQRYRTSWHPNHITHSYSKLRKKPFVGNFVGVPPKTPKFLRRFGHTYVLPDQFSQGNLNLTV